MQRLEGRNINPPITHSPAPSRTNRKAERLFDEKDKKLVMAWVAIGMTASQIALQFQCSERVLKRACKKELDHGAATILAMVGGGVVQKALAGDNASRFFLLKTRFGWYETQRHQHTDPQGNSLGFLSGADSKALALLAAALDDTGTSQGGAGRAQAKTGTGNPETEPDQLDMEPAAGATDPSA